MERSQVQQAVLNALPAQIDSVEKQFKKLHSVAQKNSCNLSVD